MDCWLAGWFAGWMVGGRFPISLALSGPELEPCIIISDTPVQS